MIVLLAMGLEFHLSPVVNKFWDLCGERAVIMGRGVNTEVWVYPLKVLHDLRLELKYGDYPEYRDASQWLQRVEILPDEVILHYGHTLFHLKQKVFVPPKAPVVVVQFELEASTNVKILVNFKPDLKPMWPAGLGGQFMYWDDELSAFVIGEPRWKDVAIIGARGATPYRGYPAHQLPERGGQFEISMQSGDTHTIIITAGNKGWKQLSDNYKSILDSVDELHQATKDYWEGLLDEHVVIETPDNDFNRAIEWGKIAIARGFVDNPDLGRAFVAGYNMAGETERPEFTWFFGGDAFMNSLAVTAYGDYERVREMFEFFQKYQREDGKMMHELSQGAGYIKWFEDYGYAYYHGDTTPWYIVAFANYYMMTHDNTFLRKSWLSLKKAYEFCLKCDSDGDGIMENPLAGVGASELGILREKHSKSDIFLATLSVATHRGMMIMAAAIGDTEVTRMAQTRYEGACRTLNEKFWYEEGGYYGFSVLEDNSLSTELTAWTCMPIVFDIADKDKAVRTLQVLNSARIATDWGVRMVANDVEYYKPLHYNQGAVWPFLTGLVAHAAYNQHNAYMGWQLLYALSKLIYCDAPGLMPEVMSGDFYMPLERAVPHQLFSSAMFYAAIFYGLLGIRMAGDTVVVSPHMPTEWGFMRVRNLNLGGERLGFEIKRVVDGLVIQLHGDHPVRLKPWLPMTSRIHRVEVDGKETPYEVEHIATGILCHIHRIGNNVKIVYDRAIEYVGDIAHAKLGEPPQEVRFIREEWDGKTWTLWLEGKATRRVKLYVGCDIVEIEGGNVVEDNGGYKVIEIQFGDKFELRQLQVKVNL